MTKEINTLVKQLFFIFLVVFSTQGYCFESHRSDKSLADIKNSDFKLIGKTSFSVLFWDIYQSELRTSTGNYPINFAEESLLYEITYLMSITKQDLIERTVEQWEHLKIPSSTYKKYISLLDSIWPNIRKNDTLTLVVSANKSVFFHNGTLIGDIQEKHFGQVFLDIWLSEETSQPKLRQELLGDNHNEQSN